jgi:AcrR family transcriptional regulator
MSETSVPVRRRKRGNREALLEAAVACLQEKGYARTTARDLVAASGTNLGAIGYHFGSKDALLTEALAESVRTWLAELGRLAARLPEDTTLGEAMRELAAELYPALERGAPLVAAFFEALAQARRSDEVRDQLASAYEEFRLAGAEIVAGMGHEDTADARAVSSVLMALIDGLMIQWFLDPAAPPSGEAVARALRAMTA